MSKLKCEYEEGGERPDAEGKNEIEYLLEAANRRIADMEREKDELWKKQTLLQFANLTLMAEKKALRADLELYQRSYPRPVRLQANFGTVIGVADTVHVEQSATGKCSTDFATSRGSPFLTETVPKCLAGSEVAAQSRQVKCAFQGAGATRVASFGAPKRGVSVNCGHSPPPSVRASTA